MVWRSRYEKRKVSTYFFFIDEIILINAFLLPDQVVYFF